MSARTSSWLVALVALGLSAGAGAEEPASTPKPLRLPTDVEAAARSAISLPGASAARRSGARRLLLEIGWATPPAGDATLVVTLPSDYRMAGMRSAPQSEQVKSDQVAVVVREHTGEGSPRSASRCPSGAAAFARIVLHAASEEAHAAAAEGDLSVALSASSGEADAPAPCVVGVRALGASVPTPPSTRSSR